VNTGHEVADGNGEYLFYTVAKYLSTFCPCPEIGYESIYCSRGNLRQPSIQAIAWLSLATFSQVYGENWEQKNQQKNL
jgi:hypothetical protein